MGRKGTKAKKAAAKKQAKALYKRRKRNAVVRARNIRKNAPKSRSIQEGLNNEMMRLVEEFDKAGQAVWWIANVLNYFASDYDEGIWNPPFPNIYEEGAEIDNDTIKGYLTGQFNEEDQSWTPEGHRAVGIVMSPPYAIYAIAQKCLQGCQEKDPEAQLELSDIKTPKNDGVWQVLDFMKKEINSRMDDKKSVAVTENASEVTEIPTEESSEDTDKAVEL